MRRREVIYLVGALAWPITALAQQPERVRLIGVLLPYAESDSEYSLLLAAFADALQKLGWTDARNIRIERRWTAGADEVIE